MKHVLNLGAGTQSTAVYLMFCEQMIKDAEGKPIVLDAAIFADVQEESKATYAHVQWLQSLGGPPILIRTLGKLGDDLIKGINAAGYGEGRFASIPAFCQGFDGRAGPLKRQCTAEYKVNVVERTIRQELLHLRPRQWFPREVVVTQYFGLSYEELRRVMRVSNRFAKIKWSTPKFPLVERNMTRAGCIEWMKGRVPHEVPRSACVFCPYHSNAEWRRIRDEDPEAWNRAVQIDHAIRDKNSFCAKGLNNSLYLHRSLRPLDEADLSYDPPAPQYAQGFLTMADGVEGMVCEGMCGT